MNSVILSVFVGILLVVCVQSQSKGECTLKCRDGEYCYRREIGRLALESCRRYRRKGALCDDDLLRCSPEQECKPRNQYSRLRYCQDKTETTSESTTMTMTMPTTPTMMTTDIPTASTDISTDSTDVPTLPTDLPTDMSTDSTDVPTLPTDLPTDMSTDLSTDMSTDILTDATDETTTQ